MRTPSAKKPCFRSVWLKIRPVLSGAEFLVAHNASLNIAVSRAVLRAERRRFDLEECYGESLVAPAHEICRPHEEAISWHRNRVFRAA